MDRIDGFKYFLWGGMLGAAVALILAPKSGKDTRDMITAKARDGRNAMARGIRKGQDKLIENREKIRSEAVELLEKAKDMTRREKDIILSAIEAGRQAYKEERGAAG